MTKYILDKEEQEILQLFEEGKLKSAKSASKDKTVAKELAIKHAKKDARINIRLSQFDLDRIKRIAAREGIPYQTMISSILHKYADGVVKNQTQAKTSKFNFNGFTNPH